MNLYSLITALARNTRAHLPVEFLLVSVFLLVMSSGLLLQIFLFGSTTVTEEVAMLVTQRSYIFLIILSILALVAWLYKKYVTTIVAIPWVGWIVFGSYMGIVTALNSQLVTLAYTLVQADRVAQFSLWYVQTDIWLHTYLWLDQLIALTVATPWLFHAIALAYQYTVYAVWLALLPLALVSIKLAREYLLAGIVSLCLSVPCWLLVPGLAPYQLATTTNLADTSFQSAIDDRTYIISDLYKSFSGTDWSDQVTEYTQYWESVTKDVGFAISLNPSTHVIWGVLLTLYLWRAHWLLGLVGGVFTGFEIAGTMLFLQHYLIDIPTGVAVALVAMWLAKKILKYEAGQQSIDYWFWFQPLMMLERVGALLSNTIKNK